MVADTIVNEAKRYLLDTLGADAIGGDWAKLWSQVDLLPFFLRGLYIYYRADLFGHPCLLMVSRMGEGETPAVVRKHWQAVSKHFDGDVIYLIGAIDAYNRKRLIEQGVPFLVPGNQLYLPMLGIDLREYFRPGRKAGITRLGAAAQAVVLREILHHDCSGRPAKELASLFGCSQMTITRAIRELIEKELADVVKVGREKHLHFPSNGRELWESALPVLQSPVKKRIWVEWQERDIGQAGFEKRLAGESALAFYTSLANVGIDQWAITAHEWAVLEPRTDIHVLATQRANESSRYRRDRQAAELELWSYSPHVITPGEAVVDPLSLWLSFATNTDERIEMARESLLEQLAW